MEIFFNQVPVLLFFQLLIAVFLGGILGLEREYKKREAGLRTYALVSLGACLFTLISFEIFEKFAQNSALSFDPGRVIQAVALGIGFIGAGIIIYRKAHIEGLTTAAGLWLAGAVGVAVGAKFYWHAFFAVLVGLLVLAGLHIIERKIFKKGIESSQ